MGLKHLILVACCLGAMSLILTVTASKPRGHASAFRTLRNGDRDVDRDREVGGGDTGVERCEPDEVSGYPISPEQIIPFTRQWSDPPTAQITTSTCDRDGRCMDAYEMDIQEKMVHIFGPDKPATKTFVYGQGDAGGPGAGPTIKTCSGRQSLVRFNNNLQVPTSVHLHGGASLAPYDGWADDRTFPGEYKDYLYPNRAERPLWYHDHSEHITSDNANMGLAGMYLIRDCCLGVEGQLPGGEYEKVMILGDKVFDDNYQILFDRDGKHKKDMWGDHNLVNGVPFPFLEVEPRKYRFHLLNACISRAFWLELNNGASFTIVGTDGGLLETPVSVTKLRVGVAERFELIIDFTGQEDASIRLVNRPQDDQDRQAMFCYSHYIAEFRVGDRVTERDQPLPDRLRLQAPLAEIGVDEAAVEKAMREGNVREFDFGRQGGQWAINGLVWDDVRSRIIAKPQVNGFEIWKLQNNHGGWFHPVHIHLVDFIMIKRERGKDLPGQNRDGLFPWEVNAAKDVFYLGPGETVHAITRFGPEKGQYMFHCHNLVHEDNDMMLAFEVQDPNADPSVPETTLDPRFEDPKAVVPEPQDRAPRLTQGYLLDKLENENPYEFFYPKEQQDGQRLNCGNYWEVTYTLPCRGRCCECSARRRDSETCPVNPDQDFEQVVCADGSSPPFIPGGDIRPPSSPSVSTVMGIKMVDTHTGQSHFADPLPTPFTFYYDDIDGDDHMVLCAKLDGEMQEGDGVVFSISRTTRNGETAVLHYKDTTAPYCAVQDRGTDRNGDVRYEPFDPPLRSGNYIVKAQVETRDNLKTPAYTQNIRARG